MITSVPGHCLPYTKDVNEYSGIRIPFEYSNTISIFEYSLFCCCFFLCPIRPPDFQTKINRPASLGG